MKTRIVLILLALLLVSVSVIATDGNTALGNVTLASQEIHSSTLVNVKFNVDIYSYPSAETIGPPEAYRGFYEIYTETSEEGSTGGVYRAIVGRFYKTEGYPQTKSVVFGYNNGILEGPLIKPGKHYKVDFYFQEYPWGSYNYSKFFIKTIEFDSLPYKETQKPDLAVTSFKLGEEKTLFVNQKYSALAIIENIGTEGSGAFSAEWFAVYPETYEIDGFFGIEIFPGIAGKSSFYRDAEIKFTEAGYYTIEVNLDIYNEVDENDENNNRVIKKIYVEKTELPKIYANLDEEFRLQAGQIAVIESEELEMQLEYIASVAPYCTPEVCEGGGKVAMIIAKQGDAEISTTLSEGQSTKVFGLEIKNIVISTSSASFIVSKENIPNVVYAYLDERFKLIEDQVAVVNDGEKDIMKVIIESIIQEDVVCGAGNEGIIGPCKSIEYAQISVSIAGGGAYNFKLAASSSKEAGSYKVSLLALNKETTGWIGTLIVENVVEPKSLVVKLDEKFQLIEGGSAIVEETNLKLVLLELYEDTAVFEVYAPVSAITTKDTETSGSSSTGETGTVWTTAAVTETADERTSKIINEVEEAIETKDVLYQPMIKIKVGSEAEIYGHVVRFEELAPTLLVAKPYPLQGVFIVSKKALPDEKRAVLNEKFSLNKDQIAVVYKSYGTYPRAIDEEIMRIKIQGILSPLCTAPVEGEKVMCDGRDVVIIIVTSSEPVPLGIRQKSQSIDLREGEAKQFGKYSIRLLDIEGAEAVFIVKEVAVGAIEVKLDEYFNLEINQTALVIGEDITIVLSSVRQGICQFTTLPGGGGDSSSRCEAGSVEIGIGKELEEFGYGSEIGIYKLKENESVSIYGVEVKLVKVGEKSATFIVSGGNQAVINVHVGKLFRLKEQQAARVLEANIRIDLLSIMYPVCLSSECIPMAEFSVSNYLYTEKEIGKKIARRVYETTAVQEAVSERISSSDAVSSVSMPPAPFSTYRLNAGESVVVGDYEIKVNSIGYGAVEFIVGEKGGEDRFEIKVYKGWTLFSMPGELIVESSSGCNASEWIVVEYVKETNSFRKVVEPEAGKAYWIYNPGEACSAKVRLRASFPLNKIPELAKGWNFVPVVLEMDGKKLNDLGNCKIKGAYFYDSVVRNWASALGEITAKDIGKGIAVYVEETCSLGGELTPPPLPPIGAECEADSQCEVYYSHCSCSWEADIIKEPREDCERICPNENTQIKPYAACVEGACEKKYECPAAKQIDCMPMGADNTPITTNKVCGDRHYLDYVQKYCGVEVTW